MADSKPTLVRIKRKRCDEPVEILWLEESSVSKRPHIHVDTLVANLSLLDGHGRRKLLFRRLQTVEGSQVKDASLAEALMSELSASNRAASQQRTRLSSFKRVRTQAACSSATSKRTSVERAWRHARYKQVWKNRLDLGKEDDVMPQFFHLYDAIREEGDGVDGEPLMKKYMPLLQEVFPEKFSTEAHKVEPADDFVYDVYAEEGDHEQLDEGQEDDFPTLQVCDASPWEGEERDSDYDSEDSNREDRPECDYPDEDEGDSYYEDETQDSSEPDNSDNDEQLH